MCLYNAVRFLGLPPVYTADIGDGPFDAAQYNDNVREYSQREGIGKTGMYLRLRGETTPESADLPTSPILFITTARKIQKLALAISSLRAQLWIQGQWR